MTMPGCKAYCGLALLDMKPGTDAYAEWMKKPGFGGKTAYCSLLCQDRREAIATKTAPTLEPCGCRPIPGLGKQLCSMHSLAATGLCHNIADKPGQYTACYQRGGCLYAPTVPNSPAPVAKPADPVHEAKVRWAKRNAQPVPAAQASFTGACGISMSPTDGRDISDLIKWHGDGCRECAPVAQGAKCTCPHGPHQTDGSCPIHVTAGIFGSGFVGCSCAKCRPSPAAKCCEQCWKVDASVSPSSFDGRSMLWCTMCHVQAMEWSRRQSNDPVDFGVSLLHNPAIPERLAKAQLASDYYDDCLEDAGR